MEWQVVDGLADAELLAERPDASPNPTIEVLELLPDGTEIKAIWALLSGSRCVKLVTVFFVD